MTTEYDNEDIVLSVECATCGAEPERPCVYVWPKGVAECEFWEDSDICWRHSDTQHERLAKVGTVTKTPHTARKTAAYKRAVRSRRLSQLQQLGTWLAQYGDIFKE